MKQESKSKKIEQKTGSQKEKQKRRVEKKFKDLELEDKKQIDRIGIFKKKISEIRKLPQHIQKKLQLLKEETSEDEENVAAAIKKPCKRGVKADWNYLEQAVGNLETLYINYTEFPYEKSATESRKRERTRKRNEISALESRIKKKIDELNTSADLLQLKDKLYNFIDCVCSNVGESKAQKIFEM